MNWMERKDKHNNTCYVADGPSDTGSRWEIYPTVRNDMLCFAIAQSNWVPETFNYLDAAKLVVEAKHQELVEYLKS